MARLFAYLNKVPHLVQHIALSAAVNSTRSRAVRSVISRIEARSLARRLTRTATASPAGGAMGYLFSVHDPDLSAKDIYREVFSTERFRRGYQSQTGQDVFLNRWFFRDRGPGFFVDVGAFDGLVGSNTYYFEKYLHWQGIAFEPSPSAFERLRGHRACTLIPGCAYDRNDHVPFVALAETAPPDSSETDPPTSVLQMLIDSRHGGAMLSAIPQHAGQDDRAEWARAAMNLSQTDMVTPCHRIDTVLDEHGVTTVDYLSVDVEGAELEVLRGIDFTKAQVNVISVEHSPHFRDVYELLTTSGFEYQGLLFFDEIFLNRNPRYSWDR